MLKKKSISELTGVMLLLSLCIVAIILYQGWIVDFSSGIFSQTQTHTNNNAYILEKIETVLNNKIYLSTNRGQLNIKQIKIGGIDCNISLSLNDTGSIDFTDCIAEMESGNKEIVVITDNRVISKTVFIQG